MLPHHQQTCWIIETYGNPFSPFVGMAWRLHRHEEGCWIAVVVFASSHLRLAIPILRHTLCIVVGVGQKASDWATTVHMHDQKASLPIHTHTLHNHTARNIIACTKAIQDRKFIQFNCNNFLPHVDNRNTKTLAVKYIERMALYCFVN